jgi:precorrin-6B methylase 2
MTSHPLDVAKAAYVGTMRFAGRLADGTGLLSYLDRRGEGRHTHWLRSLFAIHDIDALIALDVPWWTYDAIEVVERHLRDHPGANVFEFGSGASTVWAARRAGRVVSVEHDASWFPLVQQRLQAFPHVELRHVGADDPPDADPIYRSTKPRSRGQSFKSYATAIETAGGPFDLIVIDGRARAACLKHAVSHLAPGGMIVFDNSHRRPYQSAIEQSGANVRRLRGLAPSLPYPDETSILTFDRPA